jgi:hypothetical protein
MKNSAWYHKLWREKFSNIPIKESSDSSWTGMKNLLDKHMPINVPVNGSPSVSLGTKLFKLIGYVLPVVATISAVTYFNLPLKKENQVANEKKESIHLDSVNSDNINIEEFKDIQSNNHIDTSRIVYANDNNISIKKNNDVRYHSLILNKQPYGYEKSKFSKNIQFTKTENSDRSLAMFQEIQQTNTVQTVNNPILSKQQDRILGKMEQNIDSSRHLIQKLSPNKFTLENTLSSMSKTSIFTVVEPAVLFSRGKSRKSLHEQGNEKTKPKDKRAKNINIDKYLKVKDENKHIKNKSIKSGLPNKIVIPPYNYGIEAGMNLGSYENSLYAGIFGDFALKNKWLISIGFNANSNQNISGEFAHPSYFRPDSLPPFIISDARKLTTLDIPLKLEYRLSKTITLNAGTIISLPVMQSLIETKLKPIADPRDTIYHSKEINSALSNTTVNKINIGFTGGISIHARRFDINGTYQWFNPYRIKNPLGFYDRKNRFFRVGIGYRFIN